MYTISSIIVCGLACVQPPPLVRKNRRRVPAPIFPEGKGWLYTGCLRSFADFIFTKINSLSLK